MTLSRNRISECELHIPIEHGATEIGTHASSKKLGSYQIFMESFGRDDEDRESGGSPEGSLDNEQDGPSDDRDDEDVDVNGDADADAEVEGGGDHDEENEDYFDESTQAPVGSAPTPRPDGQILLTSPSSTQESTPSIGLGIESPKVRPEVLTASVYDIVPTIAAPHSTSINSITSTPDLRWVFTGGADGYIRKFNWLDTANGKSMLTVAQRHPFVDSVTKAGVLMSYWENNEESSGNSHSFFQNVEWLLTFRACQENLPKTIRLSPLSTPLLFSVRVCGSCLD